MFLILRLSPEKQNCVDHFENLSVPFEDEQRYLARRAGSPSRQAQICPLGQVEQ